MSTHRVCCCDQVLYAYCRGRNIYGTCLGQSVDSHGVQVFGFQGTYEQVGYDRVAHDSCETQNHIDVSGTKSGVIFSIFDFGGGLPSDWVARLGWDQYETLTYQTGTVFNPGNGTIIQYMGVAYNTTGEAGSSAPVPAIWQTPDEDRLLGVNVDLFQSGTCFEDDGFGTLERTNDRRRFNKTGSVNGYTTVNERERVGGPDGSPCRNEYRRTTRSVTLSQLHSVPFYPPGWTGGQINCGPPESPEPPLTNPADAAIEAHLARDPVRQCKSCGG